MSRWKMLGGAFMLAGLLAAAAGCPTPKPYDEDSGSAADGQADRDLRPADGPIGDPASWVLGFFSAGAITTGQLVRDGANNVYLTGYFYKPTAFGSTTLTPADGTDIFVSKVSSLGQHLWTVRFGDLGSDQARGLARDNAGNLYITGKFYKQLTLGTTKLTSRGSYDIYFAKLTAAGKPLWAHSAGGKGDDAGGGIGVDAAGNVYVTGEFSGSAQFGSTTLSSQGGIDIFVARLTPGGKYLWIKRAGGAKTDRVRGAAVSTSGKLHLTGSFTDKASFGSKSLTAAEKYNADLFVARYEPGGAVSWARGAGGYGKDHGNAITINGAGASYLTGEFEKVASFGSVQASAAGGRDVFVAKLDASGTFVWATSGGGSSNDRGSAIALDQAGNCYVTGDYFSKTASFGAATLTTAGDFDAFVARLDGTGKFVWAASAGGTRIDEGTGVVAGADGRVYAAGMFQSDQAAFGKRSLSLDGKVRGAYLWRLSNSIPR